MKKWLNMERAWATVEPDGTLRCIHWCRRDAREAAEGRKLRVARITIVEMKRVPRRA